MILIKLKVSIYIARCWTVTSKFSIAKIQNTKFSRTNNADLNLYRMITDSRDRVQEEYSFNVKQLEQWRITPDSVNIELNTE